MSGPIAVRELAAWDLDAYRFRPAELTTCGEEFLKERPVYFDQEDIFRLKSEAMDRLMRAHADRADLQFEMEGLVWSMEVVDLTCLLSFQRRLSFDPDAPTQPVPNAGDLEALVAFAFGPPKTVDFSVRRVGAKDDWLVQSRDPNLQMRFARGAGATVSVYGGSPFLEVAVYRGRPFLRDGYHRAWHLLRAGIREVPAAVVHARSLVELGAVKEWFFSEDVLFSERPPRVTDFLDDRMNLQYTRPALIKRLRLNVEQSLLTEEESERE